MKVLFGFLMASSLALGGCKNKPADTGTGSAGSAGMAAEGSGSAGSGSGSAVVDGPKCPPGNLLVDNACKPMITPTQVEAAANGQTRLDELAKLLDKTETVAAPIELLNAIRQLDEWKKLAADNDKFKAVDAFVAVLGEGVTQLHAFQAAVKDGAVRFGNIKGELDAIMKDTGAAKKLEDVRAQVSKEVHAAIDTLTKEAVATIQKVVLPIKDQLRDYSDLVIGACAMLKIQGGSDKAKELCGKARDVFDQANAFLKDIDKKPQEIVQSLTIQVESQLGELVDQGEKQLMNQAQKAVNDALLTPIPAGSGSGSAAAGSAAAAGSGSAH